MGEKDWYGRMVRFRNRTVLAIFFVGSRLLINPENLKCEEFGIYEKCRLKSICYQFYTKLLFQPRARKSIFFLLPAPFLTALKKTATSVVNFFRYFIIQKS
jgi:hypothetical protein